MHWSDYQEKVRLQLNCNLYFHLSALVRDGSTTMGLKLKQIHTKQQHLHSVKVIPFHIIYLVLYLYKVAVVLRVALQLHSDMLQLH